MAALVGVILLSVQDFRLSDFTVTFYRPANYLLHGEIVYINNYPNPINGREYPPFNPIWILYASIPISVFPIRTAELLRFLFDVGALVLFAYVSARWMRLKKRWHVILLFIAPWFLIFLDAGQWSAVALLGVLLCYWGAKNANASETAIGMWLASVKPNVTALLLFGAVVFAYRNHILIRTISILIMLVVVFSIPQPAWMFDLENLYVDRIVHPRPSDTQLLLPGYPYSQVGLLAASAVFLRVYLRSKKSQPTPWLWTALTSASHVSALHAFVYDWLMLIVSLAWMLRKRAGPILVLALYAYVCLRPLLPSVPFMLPPPALVPAATLVLVLIIPLTQQFRTKETGQVFSASLGARTFTMSFIKRRVWR